MKYIKHLTAKPKTLISKNLALLAIIAIGLSFKPKAISRPINQKPFSETNIYNQNSSFISSAIEKAGPAVVTIETQRIITKDRRYGESRIFLDPYLDKLFGLRVPTDLLPKIEQSQASGFIFDNGLVITNAHVVNRSEKLVVGLSDGRKFIGTVLGQDSLTDLAVIRLEGNGPWPKAILGNSDNIRVGDWAIAVGNPYGLENTVTLGIISNLNRNVSQLGIYDKKFDLIQTDAAINPGNSGGPLLNSIGEVIGINTLIRSGPGAGLSFAIPINKAKEIAKELLVNGKVIHPMIGIRLFSETSININKSIIKVGYVVPNSPADKSGILRNDIIVKVDKIEVQKPTEVVDIINRKGVNTVIKILIKRNNKLMSINVKPVDVRELNPSERF